MSSVGGVCSMQCVCVRFCKRVCVCVSVLCVMPDEVSKKKVFCCVFL